MLNLASRSAYAAHEIVTLAVSTAGDAYDGLIVSDDIAHGYDPLNEYSTHAIKVIVDLSSASFVFILVLNSL